MKKVLTILFAAFILVSGMQVSIDHHYCGGSLAGTRISVTGKLASCGMEESGSSCPDHPVIDKKCCEDQLSFYSISGNYYPEYFKLIYPTSERGTIYLHTGNVISDSSYNPDLINRVFPPGDSFKPRLTQSGICVFRI
jgi:hypothetical protein